VREAVKLEVHCLCSVGSDYSARRVLGHQKPSELRSLTNNKIIDC
jgi:hypothetical protein